MKALADMRYSEGYDLGQQDRREGLPRRTTAPRTANASAGRFGYSDGYRDAMEREAVEVDDGDPPPPPVHGPRGLRVMREQCPTCIFRPGNLMFLRDGRLADLTAQTDEADTNVVCHQTLGEAEAALCRGSVDRRPGQMAQIALRLGLVDWVGP